MDLQITRAGCLAVHLMPKYHGRKLSNAVKRIMESGPRDEYEREAVEKANAENLPSAKIRNKVKRPASDTKE